MTATLKALEDEGQGEPAGPPNTSCLDSQQATIFIGDRVPVIVTDESRKAKPPIPSSYREIGTKLVVNPRVNMSEHGHGQGHGGRQFHHRVRTAGDKVPVIRTRTTESMARLRDGQTFVLTGLMQRSEIARHQRRALPGQAALPVVALQDQEGRWQEHGDLRLPDAAYPAGQRRTRSPPAQTTERVHVTPAVPATPGRHRTEPCQPAAARSAGGTANPADATPADKARTAACGDPGSQHRHSGRYPATVTATPRGGAAGRRGPRINRPRRWPRLAAAAAAGGAGHPPWRAGVPPSGSTRERRDRSPPAETGTTAPAEPATPSTTAPTTGHTGRRSRHRGSRYNPGNHDHAEHTGLAAAGRRKIRGVSGQERR